MNSKLYIKILSRRIEEMKVLWENKIILQFDTDPKHKIFKLMNFIKKIKLELYVGQVISQALIR